MDNQLIDFQGISNNLTYLPNPNFQGGDMFKYQVIAANQILSEQSYDFDVKPITSNQTNTNSTNTQQTPATNVTTAGEYEAPFSSDFTYAFDDNWGSSYQGYQGGYQGYQGYGGWGQPTTNPSTNQTTAPVTTASNEPTTVEPAQGGGSDLSTQELADPNMGLNEDPATEPETTTRIAAIGGGGELIRSGGFNSTIQTIVASVILIVSGLVFRKIALEV